MKSLFDNLETGLQEAISVAQNKPHNAKVHHFAPIDVKRIRQDVAMTQVQFAQTFGISLGTLRHWERGDRTPRGPALVLLNVLAKNPQAVLDALS